jgi:hypothetical protein
MLERKWIFKYVSWYLVAVMFVIGIAPRVDAGFAPSEAIALAQVNRVADLQKIQSVLEQKMISQRLHELGFSAEEVQARLAQLSDQQVHRLALKLDSLKTGGDGVGFIIALLVIAILVVLLLQLTGHRVLIK